MKAGRTLHDLAVEVKRQASNQRDFIAPSQSVTMSTDSAAMEDFRRLLSQPSRRRNDDEVSEITLARSPVQLVGLDGTTRFGVRPFAHGQIAEKIGIPRKYYDRMATEAPALLAANVNHWLHASDDRRMYRTLDGNLRAFLSDRYKRLDYLDFLTAIIPLIEAAGLAIISCEVTEKKLYLKCLNARMEGKVVGDVVQAGVVFSNSEVGCGRLNIQTMVFVLRCTNGMTGESVLGKYHLGRAQGDDNVQEMLRDETKAHAEQVTWEEVRDVTEHVLSNKDWFTKQVAKYNTAAGQKITGDPIGAVVELQKQMKFTEQARSGVLRHLIEGADLSKWGVANAITRYSQDVADYDEASDLERAGQTVIELPQQAWERIAQADPVAA
jgi:hypothetical protein